MNNEKNYIASFDEYLRQGEPSKQESAANCDGDYWSVD